MHRKVGCRRWSFTAAVVLLTAGPPLLRGQEAGKPPAPAPSPGEARTTDSIKPSPLESIPDSPPPHEGALFEISYRAESPDLIYIEVLEGLPGRPITGERLVRPDGTISLDWYGDIHVRGLTTAQIKVKVIQHLRRWLIDEALGLVQFDPTADPSPLPPLPRQVIELPFHPGLDGFKFDLDDLLRSYRKPTTTEPGPPDNVHPSRDPFDPLAPPLPTSPQAAAEPDRGNPMGDVGRPVGGPPPVLPSSVIMTSHAPASGRQFVPVEPGDSDRVCVAVGAYNSANYYVLGDVATPGRQPYTGSGTVLDALIESGNLLPAADRNNIRLNRPARGEKPARSYRINLDAIERGEKKANLQLFPGDRLIIGRKGDPQAPAL